VAKVEFFNGSTKLAEDTTAPFSYGWTGVGAGTYSLTARATDNRGATTATPASTITVSAGPPPNRPPTASITSPADGAVFPRLGMTTIRATATDPDPGGRVTRVEFLRGSTVLGRDTSAPYTYMWLFMPSGTHTLTVRAVDNAGAVTTSAPVRITVRSR
jgi:Bacterial Ig domain